MEESSRISVHQLLGGGSVADVVLWRKRCGSLMVVSFTMATWFLFERAGYDFLSFVANVLLLLVVILFLWARSALLLNRPLPPLPDLEISEDCLVKVADALRVWVNLALSVARDIAIGRSMKRLVQVAFTLWVVSILGSLFNFLTLVCVAVLLSMSVPVIYEKYQDHVDAKLSVSHNVLLTQYRKIDEKVLQKFRGPVKKQKKTE